MQRKIVVIGGGRDYHAVDWYRAVKRVSQSSVEFMTDMYESEGMPNLLSASDTVNELMIIDRFLLKEGSNIANKWRNICKLIVLPIQILKLKKHFRSNPSVIYHAHPMYYMLLCALANVPFGGTPQGSELLVRSKYSLFYRTFARWVLKKAKFVSVDSFSMKEAVCNVCGLDKAVVVQNGIDVDYFHDEFSSKRYKVLSIRGVTDLYRIKEIFKSRNYSAQKQAISVIYPFSDQVYYQGLQQIVKTGDNIIGRLNKEDMKTELLSAKLVISIPSSDSSPRSVYEAIFSGAAVAISPNRYFDTLPDCMKARLIIVDLSMPGWFGSALLDAEKIISEPYLPSDEALNMFDINKSMSRFVREVYERQD